MADTAQGGFDRAELHKHIVAAIKDAPFQELRSLGVNGPLQITVNVDDLADVLLHRVALPPPVSRADVLVDVERAVRNATSNCGYRADDGCDFCNGVDAALEQVRRIADEAQPGTEGERVVAYRSLGGRILRCLNHIPPEPEGDFVPVTSDDLPDGGVCTYPGCGVDVLIPQSAAEAWDAPDAQPGASACESDACDCDSAPCPVDHAAEAQTPVTFTSAERRMLTFALDEAQEKIWSQDGFTDEDQEAVDSLRRLVRASDSARVVSSDVVQRLSRVREAHQETCLLARGEVKPTAFTCGMCEALGEPVDL
ncbi:hypothetical protein ACFW2V_13270 [Streptomyces sp. NPDC058947]|uniref:hypothetical protein n=1 Tax=Streptomyces sp. NPDC058947 TaxID=3346675 RepID=UPI00369521EC